MVSDSKIGWTSNLKLRDESEDSMIENEMGTNQLNSFALTDFMDSESYDQMHKLKSGRGKNKKGKKKGAEETRRVSTNRKIVNLPASQPYIRIVDGEERLCFKYNTKVSECALNAMPRTELEEHEFVVRYDLESVDLSKINEKFKMDNCIYPRANCPEDQYTGNRWHYETECNRLAWQFVSLNPVLLYGKKGLIQRAVDSYRNINKQSRSRRVMRQEKMTSGSFRRRHSDAAPTTLTIQVVNKGHTRKCRIRVDIDNVNYDKIDDEFKTRYSVFTEDFDDESFGLVKWETRNSDNELAVKIAYLNVDNTSFWNAVKANDKTVMLRKAVEAYKKREEEELMMSEEDDIDFNEIITDVVGNEIGDDEHYYFLDQEKANK
ncbi:hypothetical protein TCON_2390 [Astathelohania contejeani]|uniref:DUF8032 domain-containing protein n=1 Tax=Astathelohania contejeani TaxID=164912 RepID=A0ABQ7HW49_9MICR|nr:hypothetical protein TCON_2390 [Thelohania contejeani]